MLAHSFLIKSSSKLLVTRTGIKARMSLISGLWLPWPIYMFLKWDLTLAHWTQVSDRCPLGYLFAGSDRFIVLQNRSNLHKTHFFRSEKNTLCGSHTGPISWISQVSNRLLSTIIPIINVVNTLLNREKWDLTIDPISLLKLIHLSLLRVYWSVSKWIFDTINISWHCL